MLRAHAPKAALFLSMLVVQLSLAAVISKTTKLASVEPRERSVFGCVVSPKRTQPALLPPIMQPQGTVAPEPHDGSSDELHTA